MNTLWSLVEETNRVNAEDAKQCSSLCKSLCLCTVIITRADRLVRFLSRFVPRRRASTDTDTVIVRNRRPDDDGSRSVTRARASTGTARISSESEFRLFCFCLWTNFKKIFIRLDFSKCKPSEVISPVCGGRDARVTVIRFVLT